MPRMVRIYIIRLHLLQNDKIMMVMIILLLWLITMTSLVRGKKWQIFLSDPYVLRGNTEVGNVTAKT